MPRDTPRIGKTHGVTAFDVPGNAASMVSGWQRIAPQPLELFGMPGCSLHVSIDAAVVPGRNDADEGVVGHW